MFAGTPAIDSPVDAVASVRLPTSTRTSAAWRWCSTRVWFTIFLTWRRAAARLVQPDSLRIFPAPHPLAVLCAAAGVAAGSARQIATAIATTTARLTRPYGGAVGAPG